MFIHADTETTGIPVPGQPSNDARHPHIVSLSAVLDDENGILRRAMSMIVRPNGYKLEDYPEAQKVHGITTDQAMKYGLPLDVVLQEFHNMMREAQYFSAFSTHFDIKLIKIACHRADRADIRAYMSTKASICTMESAGMHLAGKRRIKLKDAYFNLFQEHTQTGAHGSLEDTMSSRRIFWHLHKANALHDPKPMAEREYDTPAPEVVLA